MRVVFGQASDIGDIFDVAHFVSVVLEQSAQRVGVRYAEISDMHFSIDGWSGVYTDLPRVGVGSNFSFSSGIVEGDHIRHIKTFLAYTMVLSQREVTF